MNKQTRLEEAKIGTELRHKTPARAESYPSSQFPVENCVEPQRKCKKKKRIQKKSLRHMFGKRDFAGVVGGG